MTITANMITAGDGTPPSAVKRAKEVSKYLRQHDGIVSQAHVTAVALMGILELLEERLPTNPEPESVPDYGTAPTTTDAVPSRAVHKDAPETIAFSFWLGTNLVESYRAVLVDTLMPYGYRAVTIESDEKFTNVRAVRMLDIKDDE